MRKLRIGFIGNFQVSYTTENDRKWSLEKLGHTVIPFQENQTDALSIGLMLDDLDLIVYSHTHGWNLSVSGISQYNIFDLFREAKEKDVPTASVHLDRWAWLARESDIGKEATWLTEYQFMADFSPEAQELYKRHNLNAYYLKPGVVERDCYMAEPDPIRFPHDIVFVGSRGYHPEYPERPALIDFLKKTYGDRFGHYGNDGIAVMRGHDLNVLYATAKIAVGDSCFGGRPNYVSDRYYETRGRGGFLLHHKVEGVDEIGVSHYTDLETLKWSIDHWIESDAGREEMRKAGHHWVKNNETYTNRAQEMLDIIFKN